MKNRLFVFGAGYSKDVANLPLAEDLIKEIYSLHKKKPVTTRFEKKYTAFKKLMNYLADQINDKLRILEKMSNAEVQPFEERPINIEYILTIIELNLLAPYSPQGEDVDLQHCFIPFIQGLQKSDLEKARDFIIHYLSELFLPQNVKYNKEYLLKSLELVQENDSIITYNYDLLVEQGLWLRKLWNPVDGYGFGEILKFEKIINKNYPKTQVKFIKLHGSVNWKYSNYNSDISIMLADVKSNISYFENLKIEIDDLYKMQRKWHLHNPAIITPTFIKLFNKSIEINLVKRAVKAVKNASKIYFIGYSLPLADTVSNFIFSFINKNTEIYIINPDAMEIKKRIARVFNLKNDNITDENKKIKEWVKNNFEFINFKFREEESDRLIKAINTLEIDDYEN